VNASTFRHFGDSSVRIEDEADGLILVLLGDVSPRDPSAGISGSLRPSVYKIGDGSLRIVLVAREGKLYRLPVTR
jgi:hypothetical protein